MADDTEDACVRNLRMAITTQRDGSHLTRLTALRQLADSASRPLFQHLLDHQDWQVQVHSVLALAELNDPKRIDPDQIDTLDQLAQEAVIANGLDLDLFETQDLLQLAVDERLAPLSRLLVIGELLQLDQPVPVPELEAWSTNANLRIAAMASCHLAKLGNAGSLNTFSNQLSGLSKNEQIQNLLLALEIIRQYEVTPAVNWIMAILESSPHPQVEYRAVLTLIALDLPLGLKAWREHLGEDPSHRQAVRYGLLLLASGADVPASTFDAIDPQDDDLLKSIVALGRARAEHDRMASCYIELLGQAHRGTVQWAMNSLEEIDADVASDVYRSLLDQLEADPKIRSLKTSLAVRAASEFAKIHLEEILDRLRRAEDDGVFQQAILLALFDVNDARIGPASSELRRIGSGRPDSLTLLLMAKHLPRLSTKDLKALGLVVASGGGVSDPLQTQASWFYLKHTGVLEPTLTTILNEE
ncbi:MAG: HEAT repeat domain-containing protein [Planctomycetota bacterium]|nr:HEAT repeat domain-containing protein [Planctomycetota bacterium]